MTLSETPRSEREPHKCDEREVSPQSLALMVSAPSHWGDEGGMQIHQAWQMVSERGVTAGRHRICNTSFYRERSLV